MAPSHGAHLLRHSLATTMLRHGRSLSYGRKGGKRQQGERRPGKGAEEIPSLFYLF